jgi:hypothetical protein
MERQEKIAELQKERKSLRDELIKICDLIKTCEEKKERKNLFEWKKDVQQDIDEVDFEIKQFENEN